MTNQSDEGKPTESAQPLMKDDPDCGHIRRHLTETAIACGKRKGHSTPDIHDLYSAAISIIYFMQNTLAAPSTPVSAPQDAPVNRPKLDFWGWWRRDGNGYDPDFSDIPWFDKRKFLAEKAFYIGVAQSTNYVADQAVYPQKIAFANGRIVSIAWENGAPFLDVELQEQITVTAR